MAHLRYHELRLICFSFQPFVINVIKERLIYTLQVFQKLSVTADSKLLLRERTHNLADHASTTFSDDCGVRVPGEPIDCSDELVYQVELVNFKSEFSRKIIRFLKALFLRSTKPVNCQSRSTSNNR